MKLHTLIVYELVPEETQLYLIPNDEMTEDQLALCKLANGKYVNTMGGDNEGTKFMTNALSPKAEYCHDDAPEAWKCCFVKYKVDAFKMVECPEIGLINRIILTGFMI